MPTTRASRPRKTREQKPSPPAVSAGRVRGVLLAISYALHATRVVGQAGPPAPRKG